MSVLKRLKDFLTGEEAEKKDKPSETKNAETTESSEAEAKQETTPTVEEAKTDPVEVKPEPEEVKAETAVEEKPEEPETQKVPEKTAEAEPETKVVKEAKKEEPKTKGSVNMSLLNKDENLVLAEDVDPTFKQSIMDAGAETVALCYQCGTCTGSCPSGKRTPYRIRSIIRKSLMGLKNEVLTDDTIWECVTCYACQERCPRGVAIVDVVKTIRNMQSQAGRMAQAHKMTGTFVLKTGHGVPINDATMALRKRVGLNELPPTTHEYPEALEEVRTILKKTGFDSLIGYNWETGELE
jgi:heterodisulfide reductase subunit C